MTTNFLLRAQCQSKAAEHFAFHKKKENIGISISAHSGYRDKGIGAMSIQNKNFHAKKPFKTILWTQFKTKSIK